MHEFNSHAQSGPSRSAKLQVRDEEILQTLAVKVRIMSLAQIASNWWSGRESAVRTARRRLAALVQAGLLVRVFVQARPLPPITGPVLSWQPGLPEPDFGPVAWKLEKRWTAGPRETAAYLATRKCANLFGGKARGILKYPHQATHDLGVAAIYLYLLRQRPEAAKAWIGEDMLAPERSGEKLPDAVLASDPGQRPWLVLEFGGAYDINRLRTFHQDCAERKLPYELY
jgi:hypothetical protein